MVRAAVRVFLAVWVLAFTGQAAFAGRRVALVIGNSTYINAPTLTTPKNDVEDMAAALRALGFEVIAGADLDKRSMDRKILEFEKALSDADAGVFHYSGHGLQVGGVNYLVPVDAELGSAAALGIEAVRLDFVQEIMEREAKASILFLDACRNNPLTRNLARAFGTRATGIGSGLAPVTPAAGTLISFSTQPGNVALDGLGRNSPYSGALVRRIGAQGEDILSILTAVRNEVLAATNEKQTTWENNSLRAKFYFNPQQEQNETQPGHLQENKGADEARGLSGEWGWPSSSAMMAGLAVAGVAASVLVIYLLRKRPRDLKITPEMQRQYEAFKASYEALAETNRIDKGKPKSTLLCLRSSIAHLDPQGVFEATKDVEKIGEVNAAELRSKGYGNEWMGFIEDPWHLAWNSDPLNIPYRSGLYSTYRATLRVNKAVMPITAGALICCTARNAVVYGKRSPKVDTFESYYHHFGGGFKARSVLEEGDYNDLLVTTSRELGEETGRGIKIGRNQLKVASLLVEGGTNYFQYLFLGLDVSEAERAAMRPAIECQVEDFPIDRLAEALINRPFVPTCLLQTMIWLSIGAPASSGKRFSSKVVRTQLAKLTKHYGISL
jgi:Caspase domain